MEFLRVVDNESLEQVLVNITDIEMIKADPEIPQDEGGPATIILRSGRSIVVFATFEEMCLMLTHAGTFIGGKPVSR